MANFCCQKLIELEPKTLNEGALNQVRELAVDMIQKKEPQESSNILLQGVEADINIATMEMLSSEAKEGENEGDNKGKSNIFKCSCDSVLGESPTQLKLKEPLSAPF